MDDKVYSSMMARELFQDNQEFKSAGAEGDVPKIYGVCAPGPC